MVIQRLKQIFIRWLNTSKPTRLIEEGKQTNPVYIKHFEKLKLSGQIATTFTSPVIHKRYEDILTALKYTKHSKKRKRLLKAKRMYEDKIFRRTIN